MFLSAYRPWKINYEHYPEEAGIEDQIKFLLGYAILAPSTFNSQPWRCKVKGNIVEIFIDYSRMPTKSDKQGRFGLVSMGCFIENLFQAIEAYGWQAKVKIESKIGPKNQRVALVTLINRNQGQAIDYVKLNTMVERTTNRSFSSEWELGLDQEKLIRTLAESNIGIHFLGLASQKQIIDISKKADMRIWSDVGFRKEHVMWVRHNLTRKTDGMPGFGVGVGLIPSLLSRPVILSPKFASMQSARNAKALQSSRNFVVLSSVDGEGEWIKVGRVFEKINLYLTSQGIAVAPMGQLIEDSIARQELQRIIGIRQAPQLFMRLGKASKSVPHSPRRSVEDILV